MRVSSEDLREEITDDQIKECCGPNLACWKAGSACLHLKGRQCPEEQIEDISPFLDVT